jgi:hypothetical protein
MAGSNWRLRNKGGRQHLIPPSYRSADATLPRSLVACAVALERSCWRRRGNSRPKGRSGRDLRISFRPSGDRGAEAQRSERPDGAIFRALNNTQEVICQSSWNWLYAADWRYIFRSGEFRADSILSSRGLRTGEWRFAVFEFLCRARLSVALHKPSWTDDVHFAVRELQCDPGRAGALNDISQVLPPDNPRALRTHSISSARARLSRAGLRSSRGFPLLYPLRVCS